MTPEAESKFLLRALLVDPLHPDLRCHTSAQPITIFLSSGKEFASAFGESFAFYRNAAPFEGQWELEMQAGVFGVFDTGKRSIDLINADYIVGILASYRVDKLSGFFWVRHQSSHLDDEFLLQNAQVARINLSYEEIDLKVSYDLTTWLRVYGGVGTFARKDPSTLGRETSQGGVEVKSPGLFFGGKVRPVVYADFQANARPNWNVAQSIMGGLQFENTSIGNRKLQVLAEYFSGRSPDGQLFTQKVDWIGMGAHLWFLSKTAMNGPFFPMRGPAVETCRAVPLALSAALVVLVGVCWVPNSVVKDGLDRLEGGHDARSRQRTEILRATRMFLPC